jgi:tRNA U34 2-thiouridine synthase MnmA/TrmU
MELVGADTLVTGHYARIEQLEEGSWAVLRAVDRDQDQSYALAFIPYSVLPGLVSARRAHKGPSARPPAPSSLPLEQAREPGSLLRRTATTPRW